MSRIPALPFERSEQDRVVAGVCGGIAQALGVDATLVRLVFAFLALAGGAGILLYLALWVWTSGRRPAVGVALVALSAMAILFALGLPGTAVLGIGLIVAGIVLLVRRGASLRPGGSFTIPGVALTMAGAVVMLGGLGSSPRLRRARRARGRAAARAPPVDVAGRLGARRADPARRAGRGRGPHPRLGAPDARADPAARRRRAAGHRRSPAGRSATCAAGCTAAAYGSAATLVDALADAAADVEDATACASRSRAPATRRSTSRSRSSCSPPARR